MAIYRHRRSETANEVPAAGDVLVGEIVVNLEDGALY